jgi:hypothetical protein
LNPGTQGTTRGRIPRFLDLRYYMYSIVYMGSTWKYQYSILKNRKGEKRDKVEFYSPFNTARCSIVMTREFVSVRARWGRNAFPPNELMEDGETLD